MASLDDLLTTTKNIVTALNGLNATFTRYLGNTTSTTVSVDTLVVVGSGRLVSVNVVTAGSADSTIHNTNTVASAADANQLVSVPQTVGLFPIGQIFNTGLVIKIGTSQKINVTYYLGP